MSIKIYVFMIVDISTIFDILLLECIKGDFFELNTDAAVDDDLGARGFGGIIQNHKGLLIGAMKRRIL